MLSQKLVLSAAGAGADRVYVDDIFGIQLRTGSGTSASSTAAVVNGIDLSGEGGIVWVKERNDTNSHTLFSTDIAEVSGKRPYLKTNDNQAAATKSNIDINFNSDGYTIEGHDGQINQNNGNTYVDWIFRKCPGFFDVVTYTGNNTAGRQIAHNLGSVPGSIWIKRTDGADSWVVYHRSLGNNKYMFLNTSSAALTDNNVNWNGTSPTSTHFTVGDNNGYANGNNLTYVAYIFAHDDQSFGDGGNEAIIKCDTYTGDGTSSNNINLGFEPQWVLIKKSSSSGDWMIFDNMRGIVSDEQDEILLANSSLQESQISFNTIRLSATGFIVEEGTTNNASGSTYIYMAIRRPHKPPEAATEVFAIDQYSGSSTLPFEAPFAPDLAFIHHQTSSSSWFWSDRLRGKNSLSSNNKNADSSHSAYGVQFRGAFNTSWTDYIGYMFKRAPGFFDMVAYTGNGVQGRNVTHNLGVAPELMIVKNRDTTNDDWMVYVSGVTYQSINGNDPDNYGNNPPTLKLQVTDTANFSMSGTWDHTHPTATVFTVGDTGSTNGNGEDLIAYLFASLDGISKVGSYNGSSSSIDVDCGFTNGARFVLIKRIDNAGEPWTLFDTTRGISSGNDPYLKVNSTDAQDNSYDAIDPLASGFTVNSGNGNYNTNGGTYIFFAIA
jgi:hypothetical protein|tara:strand:- start:2620 stop:4602 length:1983 start_codon:yes stop_codon:yes gene_type:complete